MINLYKSVKDNVSGIHRSTHLYIIEDIHNGIKYIADFDVAIHNIIFDTIDNIIPISIDNIKDYLNTYELKITNNTLKILDLDNHSNIEIINIYR